MKKKSDTTDNSIEKIINDTIDNNVLKMGATKMSAATSSSLKLSQDSIEKSSIIQTVNLHNSVADSYNSTLPNDPKEVNQNNTASNKKRNT